MSVNDLPHVALLREDHLGDLILSSGLARNLSKAGFRVDVFGLASWQGVFANNPHAKARAWEREGVPSPARPWELGRWLGRQGYDHLLVPYRAKNLLAASLVSGVPQRWSQMGGIWGRLTLHHCLRANITHSPRHMADVWMDFARALNISVDDGHPEVFLTDQEREAMAARVADKIGLGEYVVIHPFHGRSSCNWPVEKYVALAGQLSEAGHRIVMTGSSSERAFLEPHRAHLEAAGVWNSAGELSLREFFAVIGGAGLLACSSTGALHVSSALNTPSVALFCPHPAVGPALWSSFAAESETASPAENFCPRYQGNGPCQFAGGPTVETIAGRCLALLARGRRD